MTFKVILLLCFASYFVEGSHFRGSFITWTVNTTDQDYFPANPLAYIAKLRVRYGTSWRRSDGQSYCTNSSIENCQFFHHGSWQVYYGFSEVSQPYYHSSFTAGFYCDRFSIAGDFTVGSNVVTVYLPKNLIYKVRTSSCCWVGYLQQYSSSSWYVQVLLSVKQRPGGNPTNLNTPPQIAYIPVIQHKLDNWNYNMYKATNYPLPISDPDNDIVKCRWAGNFTEGGGVWNSRIGTLHENCSLTLSNYAYAYYAGWYALAVMVEDFAHDYSTNAYVRLSSIPLQFTVEVRGYYPQTVIFGESHKCNGTQSNQIVIPVPTSTSQVPAATSSFQALRASSSAVNIPTTSSSQALDGCKYYQVLAHHDRINTYSDWSSYRCDKELYGWYRFMGQAGNRMLNYCPFSSDYTYRCGSYYQGWITSGSLPTVSQGTVSRLVCFSRYGLCSCSFTKQIQIRNCGIFHVYWLSGVPSCNARYCGVKDKSSVVSCSLNYMRIDLDRRYYDYSLYSSITLRSPSCNASISSYISVGSVLGACGATRKDTANHIVYENEVILKAKPTNSLITRNLDQKILFSCTFGKSGFVSHLGHKPISSINVTEQGYGNFTFSFSMYHSQSYINKYNHYPVSVQLRDILYFDVSASITDGSIVLLIDQCYATPTMDRNHNTKYVFINNRCPTDPTVVFRPAPNHRQRFSISAFRFLSNSTSVYLHCLVFICHSNSADGRCRSGCQGNNVYRGKRDTSDWYSSNDPSRYYMLETSIQLAKPKGGMDSNTGSFSTTLIIGIVGMCLFATVILGLAVKITKMKKLNKIRDSPNDHPMENCYVEASENPHQNKEEDKMSNDEYKEIGIMTPTMQAEIFK